MVRGFGILGLIFALSSAASTASAQSYVQGEIIVRLKSHSKSTESYTFLGKAHSERAMSLKHSWPGLNMYHFSLPTGQRVEDAISDLKKDPTVAYVEPNFYVTKSSLPPGSEDRVFSAEQVAAMTSQSSYMATGANIGVQSVWSDSAAVSSAKPIVAVIDTGLDTTHEVVVGTQALWTNPGEIPGNGIDDDKNGYVDDVHGWNYVDNSGTIYDDDSHGTHVTGIILSVDQNIFSGTYKPAKIQIMPLKFLDGTGTGTTSNAIEAIYYAANMGASVLNNSWGGSDYSASLNEAVAYSYQKGAVFVAAAGNAGTDNDSVPMYPASYNVPNVIAVAATTDSDNLASFSNYGASTVMLGSPGVIILSTLPNNSFGTMSGTSMATPFVSGTAAQMKVNSPNMLGYQIKNILLGEVDSISDLHAKVATNGRLDSATAVAGAGSATVQTTQPAFTISYQNDRQLASNMAGAAGCGLVRELENSNGGEPPYGSTVTIVALILLPLLALLIMRISAAENRRRHERFKINTDVRVSVGDRELVGSISSLSLGGVQLNTAALLQDGGLITMTISSPNGEEKVEVAGRVVWSEANRAYGVAFDQAPQSVLSRIADWTRALAKA